MGKQTMSTDFDLDTAIKTLVKRDEFGVYAFSHFEFILRAWEFIYELFVPARKLCQHEYEMTKDNPNHVSYFICKKCKHNGGCMYHNTKLEQALMNGGTCYNASILIAVFRTPLAHVQMAGMLHKMNKIYRRYTYFYKVSPYWVYPK